jgi:hypothetical protein
LAGRIIDTHEDSAAFRIEKSDNGFEKDRFEKLLFDGYGIVLELNSHIFKWQGLVKEKVSTTAQAGLFKRKGFEIHDKRINIKSQFD